MKTQIRSVYSVLRICTTLLIILLLHNQFLFAAAQFALENTNFVNETTAQISNKDVLEMIKLGFGSEIIIAKIKSSVCSFDTSPAALSELKKSGVPDAVILAMVQFKPAPGGATKTQTLVLAKTAVSAAAKSNKTINVNVSAGTLLEIELTEMISAHEIEKGSTINFRLARSLQVNGVTIIESGTPVVARVERISGGDDDKKLECLVQDATAVDGTPIPLEFERNSKGAASFITFINAGSAWGSKRDKAAKIPAGQRYQVFTRGDVTVNSKKTAAEVASLNSGVIDLNGTWNYAGQLIQITQQGQTVTLNYAAGKASCNGTIANYVFQGQLDGSKLVGKMATCTQPQFVASCKMLPVNELSFSADVSYGKIVGVAAVPHLSMMIGINGTCSIMHDPRLDQQFAINLTRVVTAD